MCGIAGGWWPVKPSNLEVKLNKSLDALRRRGPNDKGSEFFSLLSGVVVIAHTRLSIIDLSSAGHQPMHSEDGRYSITFNGEIYNYRELRQQLKSLGFNFLTNTDTEVLLKAWICWGVECLQLLSGMFAFVIFDAQLNKLTCVRDAFGIKPLFYSIEGNKFLFASEIAAINCLKEEKPELNWQRSYDYLVHGDYDSSEQTFYRHIKHLMPGHLIEYDIASGMLSQPYTWWEPNTSENENISFSAATDNLRELFLKSVGMHLRSDVSLGAALSGGIDSSSIVCAIRHLEPEIPIATFSYIASDSQISEEKWVDEVNSHVNALPHKIFSSSQDLISDLDEMILAQGEPFGGTSIYAQYQVFRCARDNGVVVTLDGQGADELLAGYNGYPGNRLRSLMESRRFSEAIEFMMNWSSYPGRSFTYCLKQLISEYADGDLYELLRHFNGDSNSPSWMNKKTLTDNDVIIGFPERGRAISKKGRRVISEMASSIRARGLPALLRHGDRNSMHFSVESRVPFLTLEMANFLLSLPEHYLISQSGETKSIFRAAMRGVVPDSILDRKDKIGFATPEKNLLHDLSSQIISWLNFDMKLPFLNQVEMLREFNMILSGRKPYSPRVWRWVNFIRWYQLNFEIN